MRVIHSSDWHLGHTLRGEVTREYEHQAFLGWLLETCVREAADALVITGDVFDSATPPASAERMWFDFLAAARRACPVMDIIAIAGNHDSPAKIGAASAVLRELGVHVIGGLPRTDDGGLELDRILIPIAGGRGLVAAVPFLRPADAAAEITDPLAAIYGDVLGAARARRSPEQALIVTGHLYLAGADSEFLSERRVSIGGQESAPLRLFGPPGDAADLDERSEATGGGDPTGFAGGAGGSAPRGIDIDYVALGHIHRAQRVGRDTIRYAGAPLALSLDEASYHHQALAIDFTDGRVTEIRSLRVPRAVEILRVPGRGAAPLLEVLAELAALPGVEPGDERAFADDPARPYLEVVVALDRPEPKLRALVEQVLDGKRARLVRLGVEQTGDGEALADGVKARLAEVDPRDVFVRLWARDHAAAPDPAVLEAFERLLRSVRGDVEDVHA